MVLLPVLKDGKMFEGVSLEEKKGRRSVSLYTGFEKCEIYGEAKQIPVHVLRS